MNEFTSFIDFTNLSDEEKYKLLNKKELKEKAQVDYVVININDYNRLIYDKSKYTLMVNRLYNVLYTTSTARIKLDKIRKILEHKD